MEVQWAEDGGGGGGYVELLQSLAPNRFEAMEERGSADNHFVASIDSGLGGPRQ